MGEIRGYIHSSEMQVLRDVAAKVPEKGCIVEIGSFVGKSTSAFAQAAKESVKIYCVDTWDNRALAYEPEGDVFDEFLENIKPYRNVIPKRGKSSTVANNFRRRVDVLFIDGDHSEKAVKADLRAWAHRLKKGGVLLMHDYTENCGVKPAYEAYEKNLNVKERRTVGSMLIIQLC